MSPPKVNSLNQGHHEDPAIISTSEGGLIVTWQTDVSDGFGNGIMAVRYNQNLEPVTELLVNTYILADQENPAIASLKDGTYVIVWQSQGQDGSDWGIYG